MFFKVTECFLLRIYKYTYVFIFTQKSHTSEMELLPKILGG